ncbi:putative nuclease HARBI1 [Lucilia cuprina]|nr:putative nuclease HARBI1 [Lucilia cuprina]
MNFESDNILECSDIDDMFIATNFINLCKMYKKNKIKRIGRKRRWYARPINKDWSSAGYLAHGNSIQTIAFSHKLGKTTVRNIILETCEIIWNLLSPIYASEPTTSQYIDIEQDFSRMWNIPNCVGAIDLKHIALKCPPNSSSILLYCADGGLRCKVHFNCGKCRKLWQPNHFSCVSLWGIIINNTVPVPPNKCLHNASTVPFPHFFIGDAAFPLRSNLMRPYPESNLDRTKTVFNYRLSRARRVIENTFGILAARWRILLTTLECSPENAEKVVLACIVLHNFIMMHRRWYCPNNFVDREEENGVIQQGEWRNETRRQTLRSISTHMRRSAETAIDLRNRLADFFCNDGAISNQNIV